MKKIITILLAALLALAVPLLAVEVFFAENITADGATAEFYWPKSEPFASGSIDITGTFGGATVVLQQALDGSTWANMKNETGADALSCTSACKATISTAGVSLRFNVTSTSGTTDIDIRMRGPE